MDFICKKCGAVYSVFGSKPTGMKCTCENSDFKIEN